MGRLQVAVDMRKNLNKMITARRRGGAEVDCNKHGGWLMRRATGADLVKGEAVAGVGLLYAQRQ